MRTSPHTGKAFIAVEGHGEIPVRFDWEAISALHGAFGKEWEAEVRRVAAELDPKGLARILSIGTDRETEFWLEASPPFIPAAQAVEEALRLAFFGPGEREANPPAARRLRTLLRQVFALGSGSAGTPANSGA